MFLLPQWLSWAAAFLYWDARIDSAGGWASAYFAAEQRDMAAARLGIPPRIQIGR